MHLECCSSVCIRACFVEGSHLPQKGWSTSDDLTLQRLRQRYGADWHAISRAMETATKNKAYTPSACMARAMLGPYLGEDGGRMAKQL